MSNIKVLAQPGKGQGVAGGVAGGGGRQSASTVRRCIGCELTIAPWLVPGCTV